MEAVLVVGQRETQKLSADSDEFSTGKYISNIKCKGNHVLVWIQNLLRYTKTTDPYYYSITEVNSENDSINIQQI